MNKNHKQTEGVSGNNGIFSGPEVIDLCESILEAHRALKTISMIFKEFDFKNDNGNAFQGRIQKNWFKSVIDEMISTQIEKLERIEQIYKEERKNIEK